MSRRSPQFANPYGEPFLIYDIENPSSNEILYNVIIKNQHVTNFTNLVGKKAPCAVLLNYDDWGYFKWVIDRRSIDY